MAKFNIKTNRTFTLIRKYGFLFTLTVAFGGLWEPKLGLMVIPVMIGLLLYSFYKGRYWCGNICAHGSLFDSVTLKWSRNEKIPKVFKSKYFAWIVFGLFSYKFVTKLVKVAGLYGTSSYFDKMGMVFVGSYLMVTIVGGVLALLFAPRTWCNICPMGFMQKVSYKLGKALEVVPATDEKITAARTEMCHKCGKCARVCPMQLEPYLQFEETNQYDDSNCIRCSTCVENCPAGILTLNNLKTAELIKHNTDITGYEKRSRIESEIDTIKWLKDDVAEYTFKFLKPERIEYEAGQFMLVKIQEEPEMFRAYSISSNKVDSGKVSVTIKKMNGGYGTEIIHGGFSVGDKVVLEGPMGNELIVDPEAENILLIGGGIGITPFVPLVRHLSEEHKAVKNFKLLYGVNKSQEFIYKEHFKEFAGSDNRFEFIDTVAFDDDWEGYKGFVTDHMEGMDLSKYKVYLCGPKPMIDASINKLVSLGAKRESIQYESA